MLMPSSRTANAATLDFIALCEPHLAGREWEYVKECLDTGWVSSAGPFVDRFERELGAKAGTRFAVATVNGTSALHLALLACGVLPDDEVLVSTLTFIAPVNAIRYARAWPVFIDVEPKHWQMNVDLVADFLENQCDWVKGSLRNRSTGRRVSAILPVHVLGHPVAMEPLLIQARKYNLRVIEDATESLGATHRSVAAGHWGDAGCFSFNGNKLITTGSGGAVVTDSETLAQRVRYLSTQAKDDATEYIHNNIGFNYRLNNIQAAMGCAQLENVGEYIAKKRKIAFRYRQGLASIPGLTTQDQAPDCFATYWLYTIRLDSKLAAMSSRCLFQALNQEQIQTRPLWQPIHMSPAHAASRPVAPLPVAESLYEQCLSLPSSVGLTEERQERVVATVRNLLG
jgi:perosamine synthetase